MRTLENTLAYCGYMLWDDLTEWEQGLVKELYWNGMTNPDILDHVEKVRHAHKTGDWSDFV